GRYVEALAREVPDGVDVRGILVAPSVTDRARELLAEKGLAHVPVEPPGGDASATAGEPSPAAEGDDR
ncbi:endonuclease NucS domain-containing protein, partial [Halolamina salina]